jgi:hypothetical protein
MQVSPLTLKILKELGPNVTKLWYEYSSTESWGVYGTTSHTLLKKNYPKWFEEEGVTIRHFSLSYIAFPAPLQRDKIGRLYCKCKVSDFYPKMNFFELSKDYITRFEDIYVWQYKKFSPVPIDGILYMRDNFRNSIPIKEAKEIVKNAKPIMFVKYLRDVDLPHWIEKPYWEIIKVGRYKNQHYQIGRTVIWKAWFSTGVFYRNVFIPNMTASELVKIFQESQAKDEENWDTLTYVNSRFRPFNV